MSAIQKRQLKTAKEAIQAENYEYAQQLCKDILEMDPNNYNALVFLGLSNSKLKLIQESIDAYENAIKSFPNLPLAYQGLKKLYEEEHNDEGLFEVLEMQSKLISDDREQREVYFGLLEKRLEIARKLNNPDILVQVLSQYLPGPNRIEFIAEFITENKLVEILKEIIEVKVSVLHENIQQAIRKRRLRLDAEPLPILTRKVEEEFYSNSDLISNYETLIAKFENDPGLKANLIENFLSFLFKKIAYCRDEERSRIYTMFETYARMNLDSGHFSLLGINVLIEFSNEKLVQRDLSFVLPYSETLKGLDDPVAKILMALFLHKDVNHKFDEKEELLVDKFTLVLEGLEACPDSLLGNVLHTVFLFESRDWLESLSQGEKTLQIIQEYCETYHISLDNVNLEIETIIGYSCLNLGSSHIAQALVVFKSVLANRPDDMEALLGLGKSLISISSLNEAGQCFEKVLSQDPNNLEALSELGWTEFLRFRHSESLSIMEKCLKSEPSGKNYYRIARVYQSMGGEYVSNKKFTHAHLIQAIKLDPQFSPSFALLGNYYRDHENDLLRASKCYSKAISINPVEADAVSSLSKLWIEGGNEKAAYSLLEQYVTLNTRAGWAWKQLGIGKLDKEPTESISCFQTALRLEPGDATCWTCLGESYYAECKYVASLRALDRALDLNSTLVTALYYHAKVNHKLGNHSDSIATYQKILESEDADLAPAFFYEMAETCISYSLELHADGYFGSCLQYLLLAIEICSKVSNAYLFEIGGTACVHLLELVPKLVDSKCAPNMMKLLQAAELPSMSNMAKNPNILVIIAEYGIFCFQKFLETASGLSSACLSSIYSNISKIYYLSYKQGAESKIDGAIKSIKTAIKLSPNNWEYWSNFGVLLLMHEKSLAQKLLIKAVELDAFRPEPWSNLGFFYLVEKDYELANRSFQRAQFSTLDNPSSWFGLALVADKRKDGECMKLFEHSYDIAKVSNSEILYQYAKQCYLFAAHNSSTELNATFALRKCIELNSTDCCLHNLYGLFLERQENYSSAIEVFQTSLRLRKSTQQENSILENLARCLCVEGRFEESIYNFKRALEIGGDPFTQAGCGLSMYFLGQYEESLSNFQDAITSVEDNFDMHNVVTLLISKVLFALGSPQHIELSKQLLLNCYGADPSFIPAILSLCAMGIALSDLILAQTAAAELLKVDPNVMKGHGFDIEMVLSLLFGANEDQKTATRFLAKTAHRQPWIASAWCRLGAHLYCNSPTELHLASRIIMAALKVNSQAPHSIGYKSVKESSLIYLQSGLSRLELFGSDQTTKSRISKALHLNPSNTDHWTALSMVLLEDSQRLVIAKKVALSSEIFSPSSSARLIILAADIESHRDCIETTTSALDDFCINSSHHMKQVSLTVLAQLHSSMRNYDKAIQLLKAAISITDNSFTWLNPTILLSEIYIKNGSLDSALECVSKVKNDSMPAPILLEAIILIWLGNYSRSLALIGNVLKMNDDNVLAKFLQTLLLRKIDAKKNSTKIERNLEYLTSKISLTEMKWLQNCL